MQFTLFDENTRRNHTFEVEDLTQIEWELWTDTNGLKSLLEHIDQQYGGVFFHDPTVAAGYKSFYFYSHDYKSLTKLFAEYFTRCGYTVRR